MTRVLKVDDLDAWVAADVAAFTRAWSSSRVTARWWAAVARLWAA